MMDPDPIVRADKAHSWHPFTPMRDWIAPDFEPLVLSSGNGAVLRDNHGREYIDGNSSIWTNLHGHNHPKLNAAIREQLEKVAHTSFLGFTNPPATELAGQLVKLFPSDQLSRVFFSDNGSTAIEVALKMTLEYWQHRGEPQRQEFLTFQSCYHGDTLGAASLGGIATFHHGYSRGLKVINLPKWAENALPQETTQIAAVVIEPLIQGAAGMQVWEKGMLAKLRAWCDARGILLIADEVMTGFGRTGTMFACEQESVVPDFVALAKGITGGYLPLGATLVHERIFEAFLGSTLYYGHSYTGNQLACAAALANLAIFREEKVLEHLQGKIQQLRELLGNLAKQPHVFEVRQCGFVAGIEVRRNGIEPYPAEDRIGAAICVAARKHGLLTRPIRDVIVLMPPYCISESQLTQAVEAISKGIAEVCGQHQ